MIRDFTDIVYLTAAAEEDSGGVTGVLVACCYEFLHVSVAECFRRCPRGFPVYRVTAEATVI